MARKRISEYHAKALIYNKLNLPFTGIQVNGEHSLPIIHNHKTSYIVKVDQGVKGRFKKGLILLNQTADEVPVAIKHLRDLGYSQFLVEEMVDHESSNEKYLSIERTREGYRILLSDLGGVNIEQNQDSIINILLPFGEDISRSSEFTQILDITFLKNLLSIFDSYFFSFLEINPYIKINMHAGRQDSKYLILDAAVEIDSTAEFFVNEAWSEKDFIKKTKRFAEEENVTKLASISQAAFSLEVLNPNGAIFMLLSGGGASIVLADEVANLGYGKLLANYGEYSGNPSAEETYIYAKNILTLILKSESINKVLIIAGGVANFTDIRVTFNGLIKALEEFKSELNKQNLKIFVRRGGPFQKEGLSKMEIFLKGSDLFGKVAGPEMILTDIVTEAIKELKVQA